ncbi:MAG: type II toxin-antitoxin system mRNA interferase toxin, RelE/StbE family [Rickettsiaceae bacterium]|nr:type II toxin-antitoxin system mRNA interferase toxin, RelE/StbE family [Rickettsiaceae bacterium]
MFKVLWDKHSVNDLKKIDYTDAKKIIQKVEDHLAKAPEKLGKPLSAEYKGLYRYRYRNYRIIYQLFKEEITITIVKVGHRSSVYD